MSHIKDLTGLRFTRLVVIERDMSPQKGRKRTKWVCKCDCGNTVSVVSTDLLNGHTNSCGCYHKDRASQSLIEIKSRNNNFHKTKCKAYRCWHSMMQRCYNPKFKFFEHYGGRGIKVCEAWHTYINFVNDMGEPGEHGTLDRIDFNGNYCKENCRWVTMQIQNQNRCTTLKIYWEGQIYSAKSFAKKFHLPYYYVCAFHKRGVSPQRIIDILSTKPTSAEIKQKIFEIDSQRLSDEKSIHK